ncbi:MAG: hypothetical protein V3U26_07195 [Dehalococcoidia bacterium]
MNPVRWLAIGLVAVAILALVFLAADGGEPSDSALEPFPESTAAQQRVAYASVVVEPAQLGVVPDTIQISPLSATLVPGQRFLFTAVALDSEARPVEDVQLRWVVADSLAGTISSSGLFTGGDLLGSYPDAVQVSAISGGATATASASVEVVSPAQAEARLLDTVVVYPSEITVRPGQIVGLGALGWDDRGRIVQSVQMRWDMVEPAAGDVDQFGFFTSSRTPGEYPAAIEVTAVQDTPEGPRERRAVVSVTVSDVAPPGCAQPGGGDPRKGGPDAGAQGRLFRPGPG